MHKRNDANGLSADERPPVKESISETLSDNKDADYEKPYLRRKEESGEGDLWCD
jgi:hypothetical protein